MAGTPLSNRQVRNRGNAVLQFCKLPNEEGGCCDPDRRPRAQHEIEAVLGALQEREHTELNDNADIQQAEEIKNIAFAREALGNL